MVRSNIKILYTPPSRGIIFNNMIKKVTSRKEKDKATSSFRLIWTFSNEFKLLKVLKMLKS